MVGTKKAAAEDEDKADMGDRPIESSPAHQPSCRDTDVEIHVPVACSRSADFVADSLVLRARLVSRYSEGELECFSMLLTCSVSTDFDRAVLVES